MAYAARHSINIISRLASMRKQFSQDSALTSIKLINPEKPMASNSKMNSSKRVATIADAPIMTGTGINASFINPFGLSIYLQGGKIRPENYLKFKYAVRAVFPAAAAFRLWT